MSKHDKHDGDGARPVRHNQWHEQTEPPIPTGPDSVPASPINEPVPLAPQVDPQDEPAQDWK